MVEIEPKKAKSVRRRQPRRPPLSPPGLPPRWGEGVAPPPTPQFQTPHVSPEATSVSEDSRPRRHHRGHRGYLQRHHSSTVNNSNSCQKAAKLVMIPQRREPQPSGNHWPFLRPFFGSLRANGNCISTFYSPFPPFVSTLRNRKKESHFYSNNRNTLSPISLPLLSQWFILIINNNSTTRISCMSTGSVKIESKGGL